MKTNLKFSLFGLALAMVFASCSKEELDRLNLEAVLNMQYNAIAFTVDSGVPAGSLDLKLVLDRSEVDHFLESNGYNIDQVKEFQLTGAKVTPEGDGAAIYNSVQRFALAIGRDETDLQGVATLDPVPHDSPELVLQMGQVDLAGLIRNDSLLLQAHFELADAIDRTTEHKLILNSRMVVRTAD